MPAENTITSPGAGISSNTAKNWTLTVSGKVTAITALFLPSQTPNGLTVDNYGSLTGTGTIGGGLTAGVRLPSGGRLTNHTGATITAGSDGIFSDIAGTTVINDGTISAVVTGVYFGAGGTFLQGSTGAIAGGYGVIFHSGSFTGNNAGQINATTGSGLLVRGNASGTFTNTHDIQVTGAADAVQVRDTGNLVLINDGRISASVASGVAVLHAAARGDITNTGTIEGLIGVYLAGDGSVLTNSGTIEGSGGTAIRLVGSNTAVTLKNGTSLTGDIVSTGSGNTVTLRENGSVNSNMTGLTNLIASADSGRTWTLGGTVTTTGTMATALDVRSGTLVLTNMLTHGGVGGGTTIADGATLQLGGGGAGGSVSGDIIDNGHLVFNRSDDVSYAGIISGTGDVTKLGAGTLTLTADHPVSGVVTIDGGILALSGAGQVSSAEKVVANTIFDISGVAAGAAIRSLAGRGAIDLGTQTLTLTMANDLFSGTIRGSGGLILASGIETLSGANIYSGPTFVDSGATLKAGAANTLSLSSSHFVAAGAILDLGGFDQTVLDLDNAGQVRIGGAPGTILTVAGNYTGGGGTLFLNTFLGNSSSPTDRLVVHGDTSGTTMLSITNINGGGTLTTGNGIQVIQIDGVSGGAFALVGRAAAGAYEYLLFQGGTGASAGDGNWYLRSTLLDPFTPGRPPGGETNALPNFRVEVPLNAALPGMASRLGLATLGIYRDRYGSDPLLSSCENDVRSFECGERPFKWGHAFGKTGNLGFGGSTPQARLDNFQKHGPSYDFDLGGLKAGMDISRNSNPNGSSDTLGLYVGAGRITGDVKAVLGGPAGSVSMDGFSVGGYWTHRAVQGWYFDTVVQGTRFTSAETRSVLGQRLHTDGWGFAASVEGGIPVVLGAGWIVEPQAQIIYQRTSLDGGSDLFGQVSFDEADTLYGRLGVRAAKRWALDDGRTVATWAQADLWHTFGPDAKTTFASLLGMNPIPVGASLGGTWAQFNLGVASQFTKETMLFASGDYGVSLDNGSGHAFGGRIGLKVTW